MKFYPTVNILGNEKKELLRCLNSKNWSSFKGVLNEIDYQKVLTLDSISATKLNDLEVRFLGGRYVRRLEAVVARKFKVRYCVSANSATSCLHMATAANNVGPGDEVLVSTNVIPMQHQLQFCVSMQYQNLLKLKKDAFCIDPDEYD